MVSTINFHVQSTISWGESIEAIDGHVGRTQKWQMAETRDRELPRWRPTVEQVLRLALGLELHFSVTYPYIELVIFSNVSVHLINSTSLLS